MTGFLQALLFLSVLGVARNAESQRAPAPPAVPIEPIGAIVDAFRSHAIVALGEGSHGNEQAHAFRLALIRDPRFAAIVNDIVVECGNAKYQDVMDRFVRGDEVPYESLRQVWQNTTQTSGVWDRPIYEEFFRADRWQPSLLIRGKEDRRSGVLLLAERPCAKYQEQATYDDGNQSQTQSGQEMGQGIRYALEEQSINNSPGK